MGYFTPGILERLSSVTGVSYLLHEAADMEKYAADYTASDPVVPGAVAIPADTAQVSQLVSICHELIIPVTVRGGGTGVSGGALAYNQGLVISLERLNQILDINVVDRTVTAGAGVITQVLQEEVAKHGLSFPQNISSAASCSIGGNIAVSSGSPKSLLYGPTRNFVLNLEVVLADGRVIWTGKNLTKNATGYNLSQLFAGSEGTLGIITKVVLQLVIPKQEMLLMASFGKMDDLFACVQQVFISGFSPSSIEFVDRTGYQLTAAFLGTGFNRPEDTAGLLWIELEGDDEECLFKRMITMSAMVGQYAGSEPLIAQTATEIKQLWSLRTRLGEAVIDYSGFRDLDFVVPRSAIKEMYDAIGIITEEAQLRYTAFGHIGNGNFHLNIFRETHSTTAAWEEQCTRTIRKVFAAAVALGGTISGEHGIGNIQLPYLDMAIPAYELNLMQGIKQLFDPRNIFRQLVSAR